MKVVVHFGLPKTGTTSLQTALYSSRSVLRRMGALYPDGGAGRENHKVLVALFKPTERVSRDIRSLFQDDAHMHRAAAAEWDRIKKEVEHDRPKLLIISSEYFPFKGELEDFEKFAAMIWELSSDVDICVYFRESSVRYASHVQQSIKNGRPLFTPTLSTSIRTVPFVETAFGKPIIACNGERAKLVGGDIVADFLARFVTPLVGETGIVSMRLNESFSAEAMAVLDRFRRARYPEPISGPRPAMPDFFTLREIVTRLDAEIGEARSPRLKCDVVDLIRRQARELVWVRDRYGIGFDGVDYDRIDGTPYVFDPQETTIEDLFEVDPRRRDALQAAAMAEGLSAWRRLARLPRKWADLPRMVGLARERKISALSPR